MKIRPESPVHMYLELYTHSFYIFFFFFFGRTLLTLLSPLSRNGHRRQSTGPVFPPPSTTWYLPDLEFVFLLRTGSALR